MKSKISRNSFDPSKRYSGVYQQQGSLITDADWNEMQIISLHRLESALSDIVGTGVPNGNGLDVDLDENGTLRIKPGVIYADGMYGCILLKDGKSEYSYLDQPDFPNPPDVGAMKVGMAIYADLWDREVHPVEEKDLTDAALDGAHTCTRMQRMVQIKIIDSGYSVPPYSGPGVSIGAAKLSLTLRSKPSADYVFRTEIHDIKGSLYDPSEIVIKWSSENAEEHYGFGDKIPDTFKDSNFYFERYRLENEKNLGFHLAFPETKKWNAERGIFPESISSDRNITLQQNEYIRRWDGYCTIKKKEGAHGEYIISGYDHTTTLGSRIQPGSYGYCSVKSVYQQREGTSVFVSATIELAEFELSLKFTTLDRISETEPYFRSPFLIGDYWLATVRMGSLEPNSAQEVGQQLLAQQIPMGPWHHYAPLGKIGIDPADPNKMKIFHQDGGGQTHSTEMAKFARLTELQKSIIAAQDQLIRISSKLSELVNHTLPLEYAQKLHEHVEYARKPHAHDDLYLYKNHAQSSNADHDLRYALKEDTRGRLIVAGVVIGKFTAKKRESQDDDDGWRNYSMSDELGADCKIEDVASVSVQYSYENSAKPSECSNLCFSIEEMNAYFTAARDELAKAPNPRGNLDSIPQKIDCNVKLAKVEPSRLQITANLSVLEGNQTWDLSASINVRVVVLKYDSNSIPVINME